jgi:1,2-diacylglycerol 3-beta-galactosyltransferase
MDDWMVAADLMVTKAGPGTIAEAAIVGLPCMLSGFLPGQEEGNVPYVIEAGYGDFSRDPKKIASKVTEWLAEPAVVARMSAAASAVGVTHARATKQIAREIAELVAV